MKKLLLIGLLCCSLWQNVFAVPKEVYIIRHADKLDQAEPGPCLSPQGLIRSIVFAFYFVHKFGEPDMIIASDPGDQKGDNSISELQTVSPLANMLAGRNQSAFPIAHPYMNSEFDELAKELKANEKYNNKRILVCWNHSQIPQLAKGLGVIQDLTPWPDKEYDNVYVIKYNPNGTVKSFTLLKQQYGVSYDGSWRDLYESFISDE